MMMNSFKNILIKGETCDWAVAVTDVGNGRFRLVCHFVHDNTPSLHFVHDKAMHIRKVRKGILSRVSSPFFQMDQFPNVGGNGHLSCLGDLHCLIHRKVNGDSPRCEYLHTLFQSITLAHVEPSVPGFTNVVHVECPSTHTHVQRELESVYLSSLQGHCQFLDR